MPWGTFKHHVIQLEATAIFSMCFIGFRHCHRHRHRHLRKNYLQAASNPLRFQVYPCGPSRGVPLRNLRFSYDPRTTTCAPQWMPAFLLVELPLREMSAKRSYVLSVPENFAFLVMKSKTSKNIDFLPKVAHQ